MLLIGITGPARSGKDTVANMIFNELGSNIWKPATFAAPMKAMLNVIGVDCSGDTDREAVLSDYGVSARHMMQTIGTDWGRNCIGADMWVNAFCRINAGEKCVVSDVRFENEAALVRSNGILIHVIGRGGISGSHISESGVTILDSDIVLDNSGTLDELRSQIEMWDFSQLAYEEKKRRASYRANIPQAAYSEEPVALTPEEELAACEVLLKAWEFTTPEEERGIIDRILELRGVVR